LNGYIDFARNPHYNGVCKGIRSESLFSYFCLQGMVAYATMTMLRIVSENGTKFRHGCAGDHPLFL
jgi:hypothetical protein